jgi:hypothetical protein
VILASSLSNNVLAAVGGVIAILSISAATSVIVSALRRGVLRQLRVGPFELELDAEAAREALKKVMVVAEAESGAAANVAQGEEVPSGQLGREEVRRPEVRALEESGDLLTAYHALGLLQSRVMFWFSVVFASLGFALIALTVVVSATSSNPTLDSGNVVSLVSGTIVEAVSGLFFVQSNRARALMSAFFDRLRSDKSVERALRLAEEIPNDLIRSRVKATLAFSLADASLSDEVINMVLSGDGRAQVQALPSSRPESSVATRSGQQ